VEDGTNPALKAKNSIVYITFDVVDSDTGNQTNFTGTGFIASEQGMIITASHLFTSWRKQTDSNKQAHPIVGTVGDSPGRGMPSFNLDVVSLSDPEFQDIAVLTLPDAGKKYPRVAFCVSEETSLGVGEGLIAYGFPYGKLFQPVAVMLGLRSGAQWNASGNLAPGMSGGPVYNSRGYVVGIVRGGLVGDSSSFITPLSTARSVLSPPLTEDCAAGVDPTKAGAPVKVCRDPSNGIEGYAKDTTVTQDSG
jgi:S1-C subfamily serine protease